VRLACSLCLSRSIEANEFTIWCCGDVVNDIEGNDVVVKNVKPRAARNTHTKKFTQ
jgi:hypothetical protein